MLGIVCRLRKFITILHRQTLDPGILVSTHLDLTVVRFCSAFYDFKFMNIFQGQVYQWRAVVVE